jgi:hypothetical protein
MSSNVDLIKLAYETNRLDMLDRNALLTKFDNNGTIIDLLKRNNDVRNINVLKGKFPDLFNSSTTVNNVKDMKNISTAGDIGDTQIIKDINENTDTFLNRKFLINKPNVTSNIPLSNNTNMNGKLDKIVDMDTLKNTMTSVPDMNSLTAIAQDIGNKFKGMFNNLGNNFKLTGGANKSDSRTRLYKIMETLTTTYELDKDKARGMRTLLKRKVIDDGAPNDNSLESDIERLDAVLELLNDEKAVKKFIKECEKNGKLEEIIRSMAERDISINNKKLEEYNKNKHTSRSTSTNPRSSSNNKLTFDDEGYLNDDDYDLIDDIMYDDDSY